jgi:ribosome-binding protein aMBF1 (putative translation factor)
MTSWNQEPDMKKSKRDRLHAAGWKVGDTKQFLGLTDEEATLIELKLGFADFLRAERLRQGVSQAALAKRIGSSQSRVAKVEAGETSISLDLMFRTALSLGISPNAIGKAVTRAGRSRRAGKKAG